MRRRPPSLQDPGWRLALFALLYLYQGVVAGFALTALANHFAAAGSSTAEVGRHLAVVGLPWVLQPLLWGPVIDRAASRRMGSRRFWLVLALACAQACLAGLLVLGVSPSLTAVSVVLLLHSLAASLADTATDRMIAGSVPADALGRTSAATRAGFVTGSAAGAALFAWILGAWGFPAAAAALLGLTTPFALAAFVVRETPEDRLLPLRRAGPAPLPGRGGMVETTAFARRLLASFRGRKAATLLALCFSVDAGLALFQVPFGVALVQVHGWEAGALSRLQAMLALLGGTLGAAGIGAYVDRVGPGRALRVLLLACAAAFGLAGLMIAAGWEAATGPFILGLASVVPALLYVALLPAVLLASRAGSSTATQFQVYMAAMNLGDVAGSGFAGVVASVVAPGVVALGVAGLFVGCAWAAGSGSPVTSTASPSGRAGRADDPS
ncbi:MULTISPECIES: MFS transporter [Methylobacterium]|uniref:MFS transporter n=1 Tax=Methylobacterium TaxID=407 RepID=UPI0013ED40BE|nr:MFS transporter [Methylobacterium sp. DB0501]NGM37053.1 MFS transporter [Methylobacterium sp. DB0501]